MPVKPIARSSGKKIMKTGVSIVPRPKPEKNVRMAARNATMQIIVSKTPLLILIFKF